MSTERIFVMGDIHGAHKALLQCLERSSFNNEVDTLIQLGDVADGWNEVYECVEELLKIKNLISIKGNHDDWFNDFLLYGKHGVEWMQGGLGTLESYCRNAERNIPYMQNLGRYITSLNNTDIPDSHIKFFNDQLLCYVDHYQRCFVHGGFNRHHFLGESIAQEPFQLFWDRDLWLAALSHKGLTDRGNYDGKFKNKDNFNEIFIGHTTTMNWGTDQPMNAANIWNLDTGAGFKGRLTIMDVDTKEYYQSDLVQELYPNQLGRN